MSEDTQKLAVVTGASRGFGRALALGLAARGYKVALGARTLDELALLKEEIEEQGGAALVHPLDVTSPDSIRAFYEFVKQEGGTADLLINNAGLGYARSLAEISEEEISRTFNVNVMGTLLMTKTFLDDLVSRRGMIINIASDVGRRPVKDMSVYVAAKHAVVGFSHALLREVKDQGVRVSVVLPGSMQTSFNDTTTPGAAPDPDAMDPREAADTVLMLVDAPDSVVIDEIQFRSPRQAL